MAINITKTNVTQLCFFNIKILNGQTFYLDNKQMSAIKVPKIYTFFIKKKIFKIFF